MSTRTKSQSVRITKTYVDSLKPPAKNQSFIRDSELKGFGVRVTAGGAKAFIVEKRINGRVRRQTIGRYPELTVEQARKQAQILLGEIAQGLDPIAVKETERARQITLDEAFSDFKRVRKSLRAKTLYDYERLLDVAFKDWKARPLAEISKEMVQRRHTKLGETRGPGYANLAMRFLRSLFNFAIEWYEDHTGEPVIHDNPVNRLTRIRGWYRVQRRRTVIKTHELPAWFEAVLALKHTPAQSTAGGGNAAAHEATASDIADYLLLLLFTGLRRSEALTLIWDQVDLKARTLTLPDPKNHEPLTIPLSDYVLDLLQARYERISPFSPYVFPGSGKDGYMVEPKRTIKKIKEASGVDFTLHDLRRTYITAADALGLSPYTIKRLVNHKMSGDVTAGYIITDIEQLRGPMQQITDFLKQVGGVDSPANVVHSKEVQSSVQTR